MSKNSKQAKKGLSALATIVNPELGVTVEKDALDAAVEVILADTTLQVTLQYAAKELEGLHLAAEIEDLESRNKDRESRLGDIAIRKQQLGKFKETYRGGIRDAILTQAAEGESQESITVLRKLWETHFRAKLDAAVDAGMAKAPAVLAAQAELDALATEADNLRTLMANAVKRQEECRVLLQVLAGEASDLLEAAKA